MLPYHRWHADFESNIDVSIYHTMETAFMNTDFKLTFGGVVLFVFLAICCYLWYQWETEPYRKDYAKTQQLIQEWTSPLNTMETVQVLDDVEIQVVDPAEQKPLSVEKSADKTNTPIADVNRVKINRLAPEQTEPVRLSPNGLGAYPDIPEGYPIEHPFDDKMDIDYELIARVRINLFRDYGIFAESIGMDGTTGFVQILDENQIYIDWSSTVDDEGKSINYVSSLTALPNIVAKIHENARNRNPNFREGDLILASDIPKDILILSGNDGIDPYEYLDLPR